MNARIITIALIILMIFAGAWLFHSQDVAALFESQEVVSTQPATTTNATTSAGGLNQAPKDIALASTSVETQDGSSLEYALANDFSLNIAARRLGKARFITESPDGRLFIPDLVDYKLSREGKVYILDDFNTQTNEFEAKHTYLSGLRGVNSVDFYEDENGQQWIYVALTAKLVRYPYEAGDIEPSGDAETITRFPNEQVPDQESVVWHITRTIEFRDDRLYVSVGSGCDSCEQPEGEMRGMIYSMNPDGSDKQVYAEGLRNAVGFDWANGEMYATENGVDDLGPDAPDGVMYKIKPGEHYGWPYCYEVNGQVKKDTTSEWEESYSCADAPRSFASFEPHVAPLGIKHFRDAHSALEDTFLVALHGSFEPAIGNGYKIVRVSQTGEVKTFMDGFLKSDGTRIGRPVDFFQESENAFFFTDDHNGRLYYVHEKDR